MNVVAFVECALVERFVSAPVCAANPTAWAVNVVLMDVVEPALEVA